MSRRYVLTGAPGTGKTVLGRELAARGHVVVPEAVTDVVAAAQARGVDAPWTDPTFLDQIIRLQRRREAEAGGHGLGPQVFDRSPLCTLALALWLGLPVTPLLAEEVDRVARQPVYERQAFLVRPLGFVTPTAVRRISYADSLRFERLHQDVYRDHGYSLVDVPPGPVSERARLVEESMR